MHCLCLKTFALYGSMYYIELGYKDLLLYLNLKLILKYENILSLSFSLTVIKFFSLINSFPSHTIITFRD